MTHNQTHAAASVWRRIVLTAVLLLTLGAAPSAKAFPNFGGWYIDPNCCVVTGTRATIQSPPYNMQSNGWTNGQGIALMRVGLSKLSGDGAIAQIGFGTAQAQFDNCGTKSQNTIFIEWKPSYYPDDTPFYTCVWLTTFGATQTFHKYTVGRVAATCQSCFGFYVNGSLQFQPQELGFSSSERTFAAGEFSDKNPSLHAGGVAAGCYGCGSGEIRWERTSGLIGNNPSWTQVWQAYNWNGDGLWRVSSVAQPFLVCYPRGIAGCPAN